MADGIIALTLDTETELRAMLRLSLETGSGGPDELALRKGRRVTWVEDALAPLQEILEEDELRRLVHAIAAVVGIDALVWMTDVAGLTRDEASETMRWSARTLLRGALR